MKKNITRRKKKLVWWGLKKIKQMGIKGKPNKKTDDEPPVRSVPADVPKVTPKPKKEIKKINLY